MLCNSCRTECPPPVQRCEGDIHLLYYRCYVCNMHQIVIEHGMQKDSISRAISTIEYIRKALEGSRWSVDSVKDTEPMGDHICP
jgi:hypothetical protein